MPIITETAAADNNCFPCHSAEPVPPDVYRHLRAAYWATRPGSTLSDLLYSVMTHAADADFVSDLRWRCVELADERTVAADSPALEVVPTGAELAAEPSRDDRAWIAANGYAPRPTVRTPRRRPLCVGLSFPVGTPAHEIDRRVLDMQPLD